MRNFYTDSSLIQLILNSALSQYQDVVLLLDDMLDADLTCTAQCDRVLQKVCEREPILKATRDCSLLKRQAG